MLLASVVTVLMFCVLEGNSSRGLDRHSLEPTKCPSSHFGKMIPQCYLNKPRPAAYTSRVQLLMNGRMVTPLDNQHMSQSREDKEEK